ncbi:MAG: hypothetical protein STHCBS139747_002060 [Sporothrix thermara]
MPKDDGSAPPPPYQARNDNESSSVDAAAVALAAANAQLHDEDDDHIKGPHVAPPSYEATHRHSSRPLGIPAAEWGEFVSCVLAEESLSADCSHWAERGCHMTSGPRRCCACLDKRPLRADGRYPVYIDGLGDGGGSTTRWAHYCRPCKEAERKKQDQLQASHGAAADVGNDETIREESQLEESRREQRRKREREQKREAELQRLSRAKAKHAVKQIEQLHEREREREREQQLKKVRQKVDLVDLAALERERAALRKDIAAMEAELTLKRMRLHRLDTAYGMHKARRDNHGKTTPTATSTRAPARVPVSEKCKAPPMTEKQALALAEYEANKLAEAQEKEQVMKQQQQKRLARRDNNDDDDNDVLAADRAAAKTPFLADKTGGSSGSGNVSGGWFGRVFGRGKEREREDREEQQRRTGERYRSEDFYVVKRIEAESSGFGSKSSWPKDEKK